MKTEKYLVSKDDFQISWHNELASRNASALQAVNSLYPIPTPADAVKAAHGVEKIIRGLMEQHHQAFVGVIPDVLTLVMPPEIAALNSALKNLKNNLSVSYRQLPFQDGFAFVTFEGKAWKVDTKALNEWNEKYFVYADPLHLVIGRQVTDALNMLTNISTAEKIHVYSNAISKYNPASGKFEMQPKFLRN